VAHAAPGTAEQKPQAAAAAKQFRVVRREYEDAGKTQCSFYLEPAGGEALAAFKPGQFLTFALEGVVHADGATRPVTRCYSLSDAPSPQQYRVTIKRALPPEGQPDVPAGLASNHFHSNVQVGDLLQVRAPSGQFFLDADAKEAIVLIGGGIGITPMMSMLRWSLEHRPQRDIHLYYGVRNGADHAFKSALSELAASNPCLHLHIVYSRPEDGDRMGQDFQHAGHIDISLLRQTLPAGAHQFYICGPGAMMNSLVPALIAWGVPDNRIHFEAFGPASVVKEPASASRNDKPAEVRFARSGRTVHWNGDEPNLLAFAEAHGIDVDSGCRAGSCGSCVCKVVSGAVRYASQPDYDLAPGECLLCVGKPDGNLEIAA